MQTAGEQITDGQVSLVPTANSGRAARQAAAGEMRLSDFRSVDAVVVDAVELVKVLHGGSQVELSGFAGEAQMPSWTHPAVAQVIAANSPDEALDELVATGRASRRGWIVVSLLVAVLAFSAGSLFTSAHMSRLLWTSPSFAWSAVDVGKEGLYVVTESGRVLIPPGGRLPNGEVLLSVQPARRSAVLSSGTLVLQQPVRKSHP